MVLHQRIWKSVRACLEGIDRNVAVTVEPAAAKLLMPNTVRTVADGRYQLQIDDIGAAVAVAGGDEGRGQTAADQGDGRCGYRR